MKYKDTKDDNGSLDGHQITHNVVLQAKYLCIMRGSVPYCDS